ncbi:tetraacyldisaccharide 4'-kinase [gut metagenome]|uniref:tetraacyldisaccharide 4'-kinase n=1 Tax=gut metagenome TaxID=749906 RepID=J9GWN7_9ZZZZ
MKILLPLAWLYGCIMQIRNWLFDHQWLKQERFALPIINVGNLAVGGTGKTPHTEYLLRLLTEEGWQCAMLSRGYGRKTKGYRRVQGCAPDEVGDEPWQVQQHFPTVRVSVCERRVEGIRKLMEESLPEVILLDDAYQHRYVQAGLNLLLTDYARPYYQDAVMPAGRLREFKSGAHRAHLVIVTKCPPDLSEAAMHEFEERLQLLPHQQLYFTSLSYGPLYAFGQCGDSPKAPQLDQARVLLLCGIARPQSLIDYLQPKCQTLHKDLFRDHHRFSAKEMAALEKKAESYDYVITTEKDAARLADYPLSPALRSRLWVQPVTISLLKNANQFNQTILNYVTENSRNRKVD